MISGKYICGWYVKKEFEEKCKKTLDTAIQKWYNNLVIGVWRRLVARFLGVEEVVGSNPVTPT